MQTVTPPGPGSLPLAFVSALVLIQASALAACDEAAPRSTPCDRPALETLDRAVRCEVGSGVFGRWVVDPQGLPAYAYTLDHRSDPRAVWVLSSGEERRDHRFLLGNDRLHAFATNDGYVELFTRERGPVLWNRLDPAKGRTGGGYSYLVDADAPETGVFATAFALAPPGATTRREFGVGYARFETAWDGLRVTHTVLAPAGDAPYLLDEIRVTNEGRGARRLRHTAFWDVNRHPLVLQLARSGTLVADLPAQGDAQREAQNRLFEIVASLEPAAGAVRVSHRYVGSAPLPPEAVAERDHHPYDLFLARLLPPVEEVPFAPHTDREAFLGEGGVEAPDAARLGLPPAPLLAAQGAEGQPAVLADEVPLALAPGESATLRYALGVAAPGGALPSLVPARDPLHRQDLANARDWRARLPFVDLPAAPALHREMAWHGAMMQGAAVWDDYFEAHTITQGSVYLYGHGLDGAGRDFALFAVPTAYLHPHLARECLRTLMRTTYADTRQMSYAVQGHGVLETAGIHFRPSDIDLFFLWAATEVVLATGDRAFLEESVPYWPKDAGPAETVREHLRSQARHLIDAVGLGEHGLVGLGTGDWSDGITMEASDRERAEQEGESVPNTQMAAWVLPRVAGLFEDEDPAFASELRDYARARRQAAAGEWAGRWYRRAWFGGGETFGEGHLNLEAQIWALIEGIPGEAEREILIAEIAAQLDDPSPVGAMRVPGDDVWHAITGLLTWGYARQAPERAFGALRRHTLAAYAEQNPEQWYGIWSGPDALGVHGGTWTSVVTPMTDFPVWNANQHALPLLALLRVAGLEPTAGGDGLRVAPTPPDEASGSPVTVDLPLLRVRWSASALAVTYRALGRAETALVLAVPPGVTSATVDGASVPLPPAGEDLRVPVDLQAGESLTVCLGGEETERQEVCP